MFTIFLRNISYLCRDSFPLATFCSRNNILQSFSYLTHLIHTWRSELNSSKIPKSESFWNCPSGNTCKEKFSELRKRFGSSSHRCFINQGDLSGSLSTRRDKNWKWLTGFKISVKRCPTEILECSCTDNDA